MVRHPRPTGSAIPVARLLLTSTQVENVTSVEGASERTSEAASGAGPVRLRVEIAMPGPTEEVQSLTGVGSDLLEAAQEALQPLASRPYRANLLAREAGDELSRVRCQVRVETCDDHPATVGIGAAEQSEEAAAVAAATLRALRNAGLVKRRYTPAGWREVLEAAQRMLKRVEQLLGNEPLDADKRARALAVLLEELQHFAVGQAISAANVADPNTRLARFDATALLTDEAGRLRESHVHTEAWWEWYPGLENDNETLGEVFATLPAAPPDAIPPLVRLLENPTSWCHLRGAVDLETHDLIHILLGRGLLDQDEAFVLGFTMGTTKNLLWIERTLFKLAVSRLYPEPYRIPRLLLPAYELGVEAGRLMGVRKIYRQPLTSFKTYALGALRRKLEIDVERLRVFYRREQSLLPGTLASVRLPSARA